MQITLSNYETQQIMESLIRAEFDKIDFKMEFIYNKADALILTAKRYGMEDLAVEMETDKRTELC